MASAARAGGAWVAGWLAYEAGHAFEPRLRAIVRKQMKRHGVKWRDAVKDGLRAARTFG